MKTLARALFAAALSMGAAGAVAQTMQDTPSGQKEPKAGEQGSPGTVGAMQNQVGNKATSPEDVKRQTEGKPTMAQEAQRGDEASHPDMTKQSPGTVGAAPGYTPPSGRKAQK
jgi:hypothetical protein